MKKPLFKRITALLLALTFVVSGLTFLVSADGEGGSVSDTTLDDVRELLSAVSYEEYRAGENFKEADKGNQTIVINGVDYSAESTDAKIYRVVVDAEGKVTVVDADYVAKEGETVALYTPSTGNVSFNVELPDAGKYGIKIDYYPVSNLLGSDGATIESDKSASIERILKINGSIPFSEARYLTLAKVWKSVYKINMLADENGKLADVKPYVEAAKRSGLTCRVAEDSSYIIIYLPEGGWTKDIVSKMTAEDLRLFTADIDGNEIRPTMERVPEWRTYACKDIDGFYSEPFEFLFAKGQNTITFQAKNQPMVIKSITLYPLESAKTYDEVLKEYADKNFQKGTGSLKFEAEYMFASSSQTVYPIEDPSSALTSPSNTNYTVLNTVGGDKWQTSGQWIRYSFTVDSDGLYEIVARYRQNINDGMFSSRVLYLYSEGLAEGADGYYNGIPFAEASNLRFDYSTDWRVGPLSYAKRIENGDNVDWEEVPLQFYFKAGVTYTMDIEVSLGDMGGIVSRVSRSLSKINSYYLEILKLTGATPMNTVTTASIA